MWGKRTAGTVIALAALVGACSSSSANRSGPGTPGAPTSTPPTTTAATGASTLFPVGTEERTYVDTSRATKKNGDYDGAPTRTLRVRFYMPTSDATKTVTGAPFPLVVFSHGFTGTPEAYRALLTDIAAAGFVVAAPAFPLSNGDAPGGPDLTDVLNQPADVSFVLDRILAEASTSSSTLHGLIDPEHIATGGHSLGGITTYGVAFNHCCVDKRIDAAVVLSAGAAAFPKDQFFTNIKTPLLDIHGDHDHTANYDSGVASFRRAEGPKFLMTIIGGEHSTEELGGNTPGQQAVANAMIAFFDKYLRGADAGLAALKRVGQTSGLTTLESHP
jgi:predicted dienelactone hydrolase